MLIWLKKRNIIKITLKNKIYKMGKEIITFVFPTNKPNACLSAFNALITFVVCLFFFSPVSSFGFLMGKNKSTLFLDKRRCLLMNSRRFSQRLLELIRSFMMFSSMASSILKFLAGHSSSGFRYLSSCWTIDTKVNSDSGDIFQRMLFPYALMKLEPSIYSSLQLSSWLESKCSS